MNELVVCDVSSMVYVGTFGRKEEFWGYSVGGIHYFLDRMAVAFANRDSVILCFDSPSFRNELYEKYKCGREKQPIVYSQIETLYDGLQSCGIRCEKFAGYEADDIVEWAVAQNVEKYVRGVTIYSNDNDLCHSIRNGVVLRTTNKSMNDITAANFEYGIYYGKTIPYNTISAYKVFCGCQSDSIPALRITSGHSGYELFTIWCRVLGKKYNLAERSVGANPDAVRIFAKSSGLFTEAEVEEIERRIKLIYPAECPENVSIQATSWQEVNKDKLAKFLSQYGAKSALYCLNLKGTGLTESDKEMLRNKTRALCTGAYAADRNMEFNTKSVKSKVIDLDAFTKGF